MEPEKKERKELMQLLEDIIKQEWDKVIFSDYGTNSSYTNQQIFEKIARIHLVLEQAGIKRGDKVALCDKNSSNWAVCFLGIFTYGAVVVPMLAEFSQEQIESIVKHSDSRLLLTNRNVYTKSETLDKTRMIDVKTMRPYVLGDDGIEEKGELAEIFNKLDQLFNEKYPEGVKPEHVHFEPINPEDLALLSYTSGSTGNPKGVMVPYRAIWSNTIYACETYPIRAEHNFLSMLPLAHMFGFAFDMFFPFCRGCHIYFLTKMPSPQIVLKAFQDVKPFLIISVPLVIEKIIQGKVMPVLRTKKMKVLMKIPGVKQKVYKKIRAQLVNAFGGNFEQVILGGAGVSRDVDKLLHAMKFPYTIGYGMTEFAPLICYENYKTFVSGSCGRAIDRIEIKILSDDPTKVPGEIICRGTSMMLGYYKNEEATNETIDSDGWLHTGDLGTFDKQGNLFIRGRKKNMLLGANGQNVYPEEIEDKITALTIIDECVVVQRGQKLVALVYVSENSLQNNEITFEQFKEKVDEYRKAVNLELPKFSQLSAFEIREEEFVKTPKRNIKRYLYK